MPANRINPAELSPGELEQLSAFIQDAKGPMLIGTEGVKIPLPNAVFHVLVKIVREMKQGNTLLVFPETESLTTKAAASTLGMSRPYLVSLLEKNVIPHHKVGTHRRVYLKHVLEYQKKRDSERREGVDNLFKEIDKAGVYDNG